MTIEELVNDYNWQEAFGISTPPTAILPERGVTPETDFAIGDVEEILASIEGENDGDSWVILGKLKDGRYFTLSAWCDYTGWGCRDGGESTVASTKELAIQFGLGAAERERLGFSREVA